jgi:hypothetical protein
MGNRIASLERGLQEVRSSQQQNNNRPMPVHTQVPSVQAQQQQQLMLQGDPSNVGQQSRSRGQVSFEDSGSIAANGAFPGEAFPQF